MGSEMEPVFGKGRFREVSRSGEWRPGFLLVAIALNSTTNAKKTRPDSNQPSILDLIGPAPPIRHADSAFERPREKPKNPRESTTFRDNKKKQPKLTDFWSSASEESSID